MKISLDSIINNSLVGFEIEENHNLLVNLLAVSISFFEISGWNHGPKGQTVYKNYIIKEEFQSHFDLFFPDDLFLINKHLYRCFIVKDDDLYILKIKRRGRILEKKYKSIEAAMFFADHISFG